jgi:hypothetical protein
VLDQQAMWGTFQPPFEVAVGVPLPPFNGGCHRFKRRFVAVEFIFVKSKKKYIYNQECGRV